MLLKIKFPKLLLFIITVFLVYFLFSGLLYELLHNVLLALGYFGTFLAGLLYPYSFTSAAGTAFLIILAKEQNILLAGIVASIGALISDVIIFLFVRYTFIDEINLLSKEKIVQTISKSIPNSIRAFFVVSFASVVIASPLPTELGIMLMSTVKKISAKRFVLIVYVLHVSAIFAILFLANAL